MSDFLSCFSNSKIQIQSLVFAGCFCCVDIPGSHKVGEWSSVWWGFFGRVFWEIPHPYPHGFKKMRWRCGCQVLSGFVVPQQIVFVPWRNLYTCLYTWFFFYQKLVKCAGSAQHNIYNISTISSNHVHNSGVKHTREWPEVVQNLHHLHPLHLNTRNPE